MVIFIMFHDWNIPYYHGYESSQVDANCNGICTQIVDN
jgi:hypothetical protein